MGDRQDWDYNTEVTKIQHKNYVRNTRAIAVLWFIFTACVTILTVIVFIQPFWIGDSKESPGVGYFGLFEFCEKIQSSDYTCTGDFLDFNTITNDYFRASSFLVGISALLFIFSIICMLMFLFIKASTVLRICGWLQVIAGICVAVACIIYPNSWDDENVRRICGSDAKAYNMAHCDIKWGYILGIVIIFDDVILAVLAFVLASRQVHLNPELQKEKQGNGQINAAFSNEMLARMRTDSRQETTRKEPFGIGSPVVSAGDDFDDIRSEQTTTRSETSSHQQSQGDFRL